MDTLRKPQARFVTRMLGEDDGLFIGSAFKGNTFLEPNTIYEITECQLSGDILVKKVGKSLISEGKVSDSPIKATWCNEYDYTMAIAGKMALLTEEEWKEYNEGDWDNEG